MSAEPRFDAVRVQRLIEETLREHGLNFTRYEGAHGGLPGLLVELPGERKLIDRKSVV